MMKPTFDDVIEYVRTGEDDPELKKLLDHHPDGKELLKQARFICRMLERKAGKDKDKSGPAIAALEDSFGRMEEADLLAMEPARKAFGTAGPGWARSYIGREDTTVVELGTLEIAAEGERVALSYRPSKAVMERYGRPSLLKYMAAQSRVEGIFVRGHAIQLSLPRTVPAGERLTVHLSHGARQMPARGREVIFMPETGPFLKLKADEDGRIDMPVPEQPGTLRIDTGITELLGIRLKQ